MCGDRGCRLLALGHLVRTHGGEENLVSVISEVVRGPGFDPAAKAECSLLVKLLALSC